MDKESECKTCKYGFEIEFYPFPVCRYLSKRKNILGHFVLERDVKKCGIKDRMEEEDRDSNTNYWPRR